MPASNPTATPDSPSAAQPAEGKNGKHRRRRSRWRRLLWPLFVLGILAPLVNGPIFRWGAKKAIVKALGNLGLSGEVSVQGTLLGGPVLSDAKFTGETRFREFAFERAEIDYSLGAALKRDWPNVLREIAIDKPLLRLDNSRSPPPGKAPKESKAKKPLDPWAWTAWRNVRVELNGLDAEILRKDGTDTPEWKVEDASFTLSDGGTGDLTVGSLLLPDGSAYANLRASLRIEENQLSLVGPELGDQLAVESLTAANPGDGSALITLAARLRVFGGTVAAFHAQGTSAIRLELVRGTIDLAAATAMIGVEGMDAATLAVLDATLTFPPRPADGSRRLPPAIAGRVGVTDFRGYKLPFAVASASSDARLDGASLTLDNLNIVVEGNTLGGSVAALLPAKGGEAMDWLEALRGSLAFDGPEATRLLAAYEIPVAARAAFAIDFAFEKGRLAALAGTADIGDVARGEAKADTVHLDLSLDAPDRIRADLTVGIDPEGSNSAKLGGTFALDTRAYDANLALALADLGKLGPAATEFGAGDLTLDGDLHLFWEGSGTLDPNRAPDHLGKVTLSPSTISINDADPITASLKGTYDPESIELETLAATLGELNLEAAATWEDSRLRVSGLRVRSGETELARADASLPLATDALRSAEALFAQEGAISLNVQSTGLPLAEIFKSLNKQSKARGTLDADITATGTFADPAFKGTIDIARLAFEGLDELKSGDLHLALEIAGMNAALAGSLTHPDLNPIALSARAPFNPREWIGSPESLESAGIKAELSLPENPLAVIQPFLPDAETIEGSFSARVSVAGTLASPEITGSLQVASPLIAFRRQKIPTIRDVDIDLRFAEQTLAIPSFRAELAGGPITVGGSVGLADMANPSLDLTVTARQVLVARESDLSVRANADLTLVGPYQTAKLGGRIGITESRYFRDIEILPVGFLRPAAAPAARRVSFTPPREPSITAEPFANWDIDVMVGTDSPFLVRGNRAHADIEGEIHVTGTGAAPVPQGALRITEGEATLPFSTLGLRESSVSFSPATGFRSPELNIVGVSEIRSYRIELRVYGTATAPQYLLTSDPPLPQEDIISLIATGTTRSELNDSNVLASKAATLLLEELGTKIKDLTGSEAPELPLAHRLDFDIAGTDPRTGQTATTTTFKLTEKVHLIGAVDQNGNYRSLLKFLIRLE